MHNRMLPRLVTSAILVLGLFAARGAKAQSVYFSGFTNGLFCSTSGIGCVNPYTSALQVAHLTPVGSGAGLYYVNAQFAGNSTNTNPSTLAFNNGPAAFKFGPPVLATQNVNNFGSFVLAGGTGSYSSPFTLWLNFINPTTSTLVYSALVSGSISHASGTVNITFAQNSQNLVFNSGNGWATITVNNVGTPAEGYANVTGLITAAVTPEPFTVSLVGTGLLGLAGLARRRRKHTRSA